MAVLNNILDIAHFFQNIIKNCVIDFDLFLDTISTSTGWWKWKHSFVFLMVF